MQLPHLKGFIVELEWDLLRGNALPTEELVPSGTDGSDATTSTLPELVKNSMH